MKEAPALLQEISSAVKARKAGSKDCLSGADCFALAWTAGMLLAFLHSGLLPVFLMVSISMILLYFRRRKELLCILIGAALGGCVWFSYAHFVIEPLYAMDGQTVELEGKILEADTLRSGTRKYTLSTKINSCFVQIDWYASAELPQLQIGDRVTLSAELSRISEDYRYRTAAAQAGRGKYLRITDAELISCQPARFSLRRVIRAHREHIAEIIAGEMTEKNAGLMNAMLFGDRSQLTDSAVLYRAGIGHITAVSGLHLMFFCGAAGFLLRRLRLSRRLHFLMTLLTVGIFILLVDASISVYRAACMLLISRPAGLFGRKGSTFRALTLTMFLCTLIAPYVIGSASFWLSVSGVFGIGVFAPYITKRMQLRGFQEKVVSLICVSAAVFPASALLTGESSLLSPLSNLAALPFGIAALYIGFSLLLTNGLTAFLLPAAELCCRVMCYLANAVAGLPFSQFTASAPAVRTMILCSAAAVLLLLILRASPKRIACCITTIAVLLAGQTVRSRAEDEKHLQAAILGNRIHASAVISYGGETIFVDLSGSETAPEYAARYLSDQGIHTLSCVLLRAESDPKVYAEKLADTKISTIMVCGEGQTLTGNLGGAELRYSGEAAEVIVNGQTFRAENIYRRVLSWNGVSYAAQGENVLFRSESDGTARVVLLEP